MSEDGEPIGILELDGNLADAEKPPILPAGPYIGEVNDVQILTSQAGNRYFAIKFVVGPEQIRPDIAEQFDDGAILYWNRQVLPDGNDRRAKWNLRKLMEALGLDTKTTSIDPNDWMGKTAKLQVRHSRFNGEDRAEISSLHPVETAREAPKQTAQTAAPAAARGGRAGRK